MSTDFFTNVTVCNGLSNSCKMATTDLMSFYRMPNSCLSLGLHLSSSFVSFVYANFLDLFSTFFLEMKTCVVLCHLIGF